MPPKVRRPAAALAKGFPKAKAAPGRVRPRIRRPAAALSPEEAWRKGEEVDAAAIPVSELKAGMMVMSSQGDYFGNLISFAGEVKGLLIEGSALELKLQMTGTDSEDLLKFVSANPHQEVMVHLCDLACPKSPQGERIIHCSKLQQMPRDAPPWTGNLKEAGDELARLRGLEEADREERRRKEEEQKRKEEKKRKERKESSEREGKAKRRRKEKKRSRSARSKESAESSKGDLTSSGGDGDKKKRKRKKKKAKVRVEGQKKLSAIFGRTGLDPDPAARKRIRKRMVKRVRKKARSSSSSSENSTTTSIEEISEEMFESGQKVHRMARIGPGCLTASGIKEMQRQLLTRQGEAWESDQSSVPPICLQYYRQQLQGRLSGGIAREALSLCHLLDTALRGQVSLALDVAMQRVKSIELSSGQVGWAVAQRLELAPTDRALITSRQEASEAAKEQLAEYRALHPKPWETGGKAASKGEPKKGESGSKGKGKWKKGKDKDANPDKGEKK